jgi:hypothetical protein
MLNNWHDIANTVADEWEQWGLYGETRTRSPVETLEDLKYSKAAMRVVPQWPEVAHAVLTAWQREDLHFFPMRETPAAMLRRLAHSLAAASAVRELFSIPREPRTAREREDLTFEEARQRAFASITRDTLNTYRKGWLAGFDAATRLAASERGDA